MFETTRSQQVAQLHDNYMMTMMMMMMIIIIIIIIIMATTTMNATNELLELHINAKFQTTKQAGGKEIGASTNYPVCSMEGLYIRTFKSPLSERGRLYDLQPITFAVRGFNKTLKLSQMSPPSVNCPVTFLFPSKGSNELNLSAS